MGSQLTSLSGNFTGIPAGAYLSSYTGTGLTTPEVTASAGTGTGITVETETTAAQATATTVGWAPAAGLSFTDATFATPTNEFTTAGSTGGQAGIGVTSTTSFTISPALPIEFGGTSGVGSANCLETGWTSTDAPGPSQDGATTPQLPPGEITPILSTTPTFEPGAYVSLVDTPPTANNQTVSINVTSSGSFNLNVIAGSYVIDPNGYSLVDGSPQTQGNITVTQVGTTSTVDYVDTDTSVASYTFTWERV